MASEMICDVSLDSVSAEIFYNAPKQDTYFKFQKSHPKVKKGKGVFTIISEFNDTNVFYSYNEDKKVVESTFWIRNFRIFRSKRDFHKFTYKGYSEEFKKHVVFMEYLHDYEKTSIFIDSKTGNRTVALTQPVFSPNRKKMASFQAPRPDLGHDLMIQEIEDNDIITIYETSLYNMGDWVLVELRWLDNETLVINAKSPRPYNINVPVKQKECFYKLSLIKCDNE